MRKIYIVFPRSINRIGDEERVLKEFQIWRNDGGFLHRDDGPAVIRIRDGAEYWYYNGLMHRIYGPAFSNGDKTEFGWYIAGKEYTFEDWCRRTERTEEEVTLFKLKYGLR